MTNDQLELIRERFLAGVSKMSVAPIRGDIISVRDAIRENHSTFEDLIKHLDDVLKSVLADLNINPDEEGRKEIGVFLKDDIQRILSGHIIGK